MTTSTPLSPHFSILTYIYGLYDPRCPDEIRYIGQSSRPRLRFGEHCRPVVTAHAYRDEWIRSLLADGIQPGIRLLEAAYDDTADYIETCWIAQCARQNMRLTNTYHTNISPRRHRVSAHRADATFSLVQDIAVALGVDTEAVRIAMIECIRLVYVTTHDDKYWIHADAVKSLTRRIRNDTSHRQLTSSGCDWTIGDDPAPDIAMADVHRIVLLPRPPRALHKGDVAT